MLPEEAARLLTAPAHVIEAAGLPLRRLPPARGHAYSDDRILSMLWAAATKPTDDDRTCVVSVDHRLRYATERSRLPSPVYDLFKPGRSVSYLLSRGVTRKTIKRAAKAGWVVLEKHTNKERTRENV